MIWQRLRELPSLEGRGWGWVRRRRPKLRLSRKSRCARLPTPAPSLAGRGIALSLLLAMLSGGWAVAQAPAGPTLAQAQREAAVARKRSEQLEGQARRATGEAARANAAAAALASRIEAAEADITAAQARIALIERLSAEQRARLAASQGSLIRLTAALQTMARRPPALALIQPGSLNEVVHVRALLASSLPASEPGRRG